MMIKKRGHSHYCDSCKINLNRVEGDGGTGSEVWCKACKSNIVCYECFFSIGIRVDEQYHSRSRELREIHYQDKHNQINIS